jgi:hypothetical protein
MCITKKQEGMRVVHNKTDYSQLEQRSATPLHGCTRRGQYYLYWCMPVRSGGDHRTTSEQVYPLAQHVVWRMRLYVVWVPPALTWDSMDNMH